MQQLMEMQRSVTELKQQDAPASVIAMAEKLRDQLMSQLDKPAFTTPPAAAQLAKPPVQKITSKSKIAKKKILVPV